MAANPDLESQDETTETEIPRRRYDAPTRRFDHASGTESGVTNVLEAAGTGTFSYSSPEEESSSGTGDEEEEEQEDESEDDELYATIPVAHQRPRRMRRPPDRYSPS